MPRVDIGSGKVDERNIGQTGEKGKNGIAGGIAGRGSGVAKGKAKE